MKITPKLSGSLSVIVLASAVGCAGTATKKSMDPNSPVAQWLKREQKLPAQKAIKAPDGYFSATVAASAPATFEKPSESGYDFAVPIGTESKVECYLHTSAHNPGSVVEDISERALGNAQEKEIVGIDSGVFGNTPYVQMDTHYLAQQEGEAAFGHLKVIAVGFPENTLMCLHDEPGYSETFKKVVSGLTQSFKRRDPLSLTNAKYHEIHVVSMNGAKIGFSETFVYPMKDKTELTKTVVNFVMPLGQEKVLVNYNLAVERTNLAGVILRGSYLGYTGDTMTYQVTTEIEDAKKYRVKGKIHGKEMDESMVTESTLVGSFRQADYVKKYLLENKSNSEFSLWGYYPDMAQAKPTAVAYRKLASVESSQKETQIEMTMGSTKTTGTVDKNGRSKTMNLSMSGLNFEIKRVYSKGNP